MCPSITHGHQLILFFLGRKICTILPSLTSSNVQVASVVSTDECSLPERQKRMSVKQQTAQRVLFCERKQVTIDDSRLALDANIQFVGLNVNFKVSSLDVLWDWHCNVNVRQLLSPAVLLFIIAIAGVWESSR